MSGLAAFITKRQQKQDFLSLYTPTIKPKVCLSKIIRTKIYNRRDYVANYLNDIEKCVTISRIRKIKLSLVASGTSRHSPNKRQKMWHYHVHCMEKSQCDHWKLVQLRHSSHTYNYNATLLQKQPETPSSIARAIRKVQKWLRAQLAAEKKKRLHKKIKLKHRAKETMIIFWVFQSVWSESSSHFQSYLLQLSWCKAAEQNRNADPQLIAPPIGQL